MIKTTDNRAYSDTGSQVHRKGTAHYGAELTMLPGETADSFEEAAAASATEDETERKRVIEGLIRRRYTVSDELGLLRQRDSKPEEFAEYNTYVEQCKRLAREMTAKETDNQ